MDLKKSLTSAMEAVMKKAVVTHNEENQAKIPDLSVLSAEEREFYNLMFGDDIASVRHRKLHCTACDVHIGSAPAKSGNMHAHPILSTLLCYRCRNFYGDGNFEQGEDATDMFCRWCANGGNLYCCSYCSNTFCDKCIKRNFDPLIRQKIEDEERWKCFVCDPTDLYSARAVCWALLKHVHTVIIILRNDQRMSTDELREKMTLDEAKCCVRRRKMKRRKIGADESEEEDETYHPNVNLSLSARRKILRRSSRSPLNISRESVNTEYNNRNQTKTTKTEVDNYNDEDEDDLPPPMIPCVQYMVEGDSSETLNATLNSQSTLPPLSSGSKAITPSRNSQSTVPLLSSSRDPSIPMLQINPIPTANLLKITPPPLSTIKNSIGKHKRLRTLQHILPAPQPQHKFLMLKNPQTPGGPTTSMHTIEYSSLPLRAPHLQPNVPMVAIPATSSTYKPLSPRILVQKPKPPPAAALNPTPNREVKVIEIDIDSDEAEPTDNPTDKQTNGNDASVQDDDILKHILDRNSMDKTTNPDSSLRKRMDKSNNAVEEEIDLQTEEIRVLFRMVGSKLRKVPLIHLPNHNNLRSTRVKTRRFHLAIAKTISDLCDINDKVIHKYSSWRQTMLLEARQTRSNDNVVGEKADDLEIPLEMICTNSGSESESNEAYDSDSMFSTEKMRYVKSFQERDTVDVGVGSQISTADKSVQAFDVVDRDYEKCIGHSVLTKVVYDPVDGSELLKPVIIPDQHTGKFEEQFIFYLQHREENEIKTDDERGLPDPNETPLKDLIEANSPFVLEMLESIDSPLANEIVTNENKANAETSDESGKENKDQGETTNVVKELAKMVTELSEDLKTSRNSDALSKKHSEFGKKERRKQVFDHTGSEEVNIAVQTLIEENEQSRSSSNEDDCNSGNTRHLTIEAKLGARVINEEDECTIID